MPDIANALNTLPVIGYAFQMIGYIIANIGVISQTTVAVAIPITLAALCGVMCERSGVVNIGLEGIMLIAAFVGWVAGVVAVGFFPHETGTAIFGITLPLLIGVIAAVLAGMLVSLLHAWLSISLRVDQIISGTIINIGAIGLTGYLNNLISRQSPVGAGNFKPFVVDPGIVNIPVIGWIINALFNQGPIGITTIVLVVVLQVMLFRSKWGLRSRAAGEHPRAAETVGVDVIRLRYRNVVLSGALAALGGAWLSMEWTNGFQPNMTAGRGFIGLAAMIVGRWTPLGAFGAALLFSSATAVSSAIVIGPPSGDLGNFLADVPSQFWDALPYLITIIVLAGLIGRSIAPAADGQPYERESAS